jgi:hypothetical protein
MSQNDYEPKDLFFVDDGADWLVYHRSAEGRVLARVTPDLAGHTLDLMVGGEVVQSCRCGIDRHEVWRTIGDHGRATA